MDLRNNEIEVLELKIKITQMRNLIDGFSSKLNTAEKRISV